MGACLSCLIPDNDNDNDENTSLLCGEHNQYSNFEQEEELKLQQRQRELNTIVNDLSDNLIDVLSFLNSPNTAANPPNLMYLVANSLHLQNTHEDDVDASGGGDQKTYPYQYTSSDKEKVVSEVGLVPEAVKQACKVELNDTLYLKL